MSMTKPIALSVPAFDKSTLHTFYFTSSGGNQVVKNRLTIRNNNTNAIVYQSTVESFLFKQDVPANTLVNGVYYNYYFNTYDVDNNISPDSNVVPFYCYSAPVISFTNAPSNNRIENSSYSFGVTYSQAQGELLESLIYYLYDANGNELSNSGKLYSSITPPISFTYEFKGFLDSETYKVQVKAISINGTQTSSSLYTFTALYDQPYILSLLEVSNNSDEGYVNITTNVVLVEGSVSPAPALFLSEITDGNEANYIKWNEWFTVPETNIISQWASRYSLLMTDQSKLLTFNGGVDIPSSFQYQLWMKPVTDGVVCNLYKSTLSSNKLTLTLKSGIPSGQSTVKNWFELTTTDGSLLDYSNYVNAMNRDTKFTMWFKKVGNVYNLLLEVIDVGSGSTISWGGSATYPTSKIHNSIEGIFPIDTVTLRNGVFDNIDITTDTTRAYSVSYPVFDYWTKLNCDFSDLSGGNLDIALAQTESIKIKRRKSSSFDWVTLYNVPITSASDLNLVKRDCLVPTNETFEYAIVPIMSGGVEGNYIISQLTTCFNWCYLCDGDTIIKFYSNVSYPTIMSNPVGGVFAPIGRRTPITIYNSTSDYETGTFSGNVLGENFLSTRTIDRKDVQDTLKIYEAFIKNKKPKILKDWDGRIKIVDTNVENGLAQNVNLIGGFSNLSLSWVEKGNYDNQQDLYDNGLVDTL